MKINAKSYNYGVCNASVSWNEFTGCGRVQTLKLSVQHTLRYLKC